MNEQRCAQCGFFTKQDQGQVSPPQLVYDLKKKHFICYILLNDQISLSHCLYFWDIGQYVYSN